MQRKLVWTILSLVLAGAGAAHAGDFCDHPQFAEVDGIGGNGNGCEQMHSTLPGGSDPLIDGSGDIVGIPDESTKALPSFSELDLVPYYLQLESKPIEFDLDITDLNLVDPGAHVDIMEFTLQSLGVGSDGISDSCSLTMAVNQDSAFASGRSLSFSWICSREEPGFGGEPLRTFDYEQKFVALGTSTQKLAVAIRPDKDWGTLKIVATAQEGTWSPFVDEELIFTTTAKMRWDGVQPWSLRSGILSGAPLHTGMTTRFTYYSPGFVD